MDDATESGFDYSDDADAPGWKRWRIHNRERYNAFFEPLLIRREGDVVRVRMTPRSEQSNMFDNLHGGALLGFIDVALFAAGLGFDVADAIGGVTVDLSTQFIAPAALDAPVDAVVELLRETGRMLFLRGLIVQGADAGAATTIASFSATIRRASARKPA